jgi:hypothetical protein
MVWKMSKIWCRRCKKITKLLTDLYDLDRCSECRDYGGYIHLTRYEAKLLKTLIELDTLGIIKCVI